MPSTTHLMLRSAQKARLEARTTSMQALVRRSAIDPADYVVEGAVWHSKPRMKVVTAASTAALIPRRSALASRRSR
jgi:hypothetical protein